MEERIPEKWLGFLGLSTPANCELQSVGEPPAVPGADGPLDFAVPGHRQDDGHIPSGVRFYHDMPSDVVRAVQSLCLLHGASLDHKGVVT